MPTLTDDDVRFALMLFDVGALPPPLMSFVFTRPHRLRPDTYQAIGRHLFNEAVTSNVRYHRIAGIPPQGDLLADAISANAKNLGRQAVIRLGRDVENEGEDYEGDVSLEVITEGAFRPGDQVLLVNDVVQDGTRELEAIKVLEENDLAVQDILVLVDYERGGKKELQLAGDYKPHALFTISQLIELYYEYNRINRKTYEEIKTSLASRSHP